MMRTRVLVENGVERSRGEFGVCLGGFWGSADSLLVEADPL
jgi:hypothetical protein